MLQTEDAPTGLAKYVPIAGWLPRYQPAWLRFDLVAGLTATAVEALVAGKVADQGQRRSNGI